MRPPRQPAFLALTLALLAWAVLAAWLPLPKPAHARKRDAAHTRSASDIAFVPGLRVEMAL